MLKIDEDKGEVVCSCCYIEFIHEFLAYFYVFVINVKKSGNIVKVLGHIKMEKKMK